MSSLSEIDRKIQEEISRLVALDAVTTFVDARHSPFQISFCDCGLLPVTVDGDLGQLQRLFAQFRQECNVEVAPLWMCAVHFTYGRKHSMHCFYEGDYDFRLESAELMRVVVSELFEQFDPMESARRTGDKGEP